MHPGDLADRHSGHPQLKAHKEPTMLSLRKSFAALSLAAATALAGCASDHKPEGYHRARPDITEIDSRDRGLQSSEVVEASEMLANKLLSLPEVTSSPRRLTVVFTHLEDLT